MNSQEALRSWSKVTMQIQNDWSGWGTGFLIKPVFSFRGQAAIKFFLVTNKHVLSPEPRAREEAEAVTIFPLVKQSDDSVRREARVLSLRYEDGSPRWRGHPDPAIDVMVFDLTDVILEDTCIEHDAPDLTVFVNSEWLSRLGISVSDDVVVIGFPAIGRTPESDPVFRHGTISTPVGKQIEFMADAQVKSLRAFAIDGETIPGSSGSPVILKPTIGRQIAGRNYFSMAVPPVLLGVLAETPVIRVQNKGFDGWTYSGIGIAFEADTVAETIKLYVS